jgi:hypothetical protein
MKFAGNGVRKHRVRGVGTVKLGRTKFVGERKGIRGLHANCMASPVAGTLHFGATEQKASNSKYGI